MKEDVAKHLEFIQAIIARMAGNSFLLKAWSVTLAAALFALAVKDVNRLFAILAFFPAASFWGLDAYYLRQERLFRCLYDDVRKTPSGTTTPVEPFSLSTAKYCESVHGWFRTMWTPSLIGFHGPVVLVVLAVVVILRVYG
jgi:hypothetical protein